MLPGVSGCNVGVAAQVPASPLHADLQLSLLQSSVATSSESAVLPTESPHALMQVSSLPQRSRHRRRMPHAGSFEHAVSCEQQLWEVHSSHAVVPGEQLAP